MERDIEKDLMEIACAAKGQAERDNAFTLSVLQRCYKLVSELKVYKDFEEKGKLLKLPCAVGDRIYRIDMDEKLESREIEIYEIDNIVILSDGTVLLKYDSYDGVICELENIITDKPYLDFYRCFLTREEAEATLKE